MVPLKRFTPLLGAAAILLVLATCSSTEEADVPPTPTTAPVQQPQPGATAAPGAPAMPAATAMPGATAMPQPTAAPVGEPKYGGIFVHATRADPPGWDPDFVGTISLYNHAGSMYGVGNLTRPCREDVFFTCPNLASEWEISADFTVWTFTIRDNAFWHDGQPVTAEDFKFWIEMQRGSFAEQGRRAVGAGSRWGNVVSIEVLPGNKLRITLPPGQGVPTYLAGTGFGSNPIAHPKHLMLPEIEAGNATVSPADIDFVATGPFKMKEYRRGSVVRVRPFDQYWEKDDQGRQLPFLDGIDFPIIGDTNTMVAAFRAGRIDATARGTGFALTPQQRDSITKDLGNGAYFEGWDDTNMGIRPNPTAAPWDDVRVRKALFLWVDRQAACTVILGGDCTVVPMYPPRAPWYDPAVQEWPGMNPATKEQDRAEAKRLLADAGFPDGFETTLMCRSVWLANCEFYDQQLRGLLGDDNVTLELVDTATNTDRGCNFQYDVTAHGGIGGDEAVPYTYESALSSVSACGAPTGIDPKLDQMFSDVKTAKTAEERVRLGREIAEFATLEQAYFIQVFKEHKIMALRSYVKGFIAPAVVQTNNTTHATVWLDK